MRHEGDGGRQDVSGLMESIDALVQATREGGIAPGAALAWSRSVIATREPHLHAWAHLPEADEVSSCVGPLAGVPFGVKDVLDVAGMPTACGLADRHARPSEVDAACVGLLRAAGAVPIGKTVTAEYAFRQPGPTVNPWRADHTPGGSSSGSAVAVAAGMVPFALSTQTGGSVIRPAAYCGVPGFKPSFGLVPRMGLHLTSESLDVIGWHASSMENLAAVARVLLPLPDRAPVQMPWDKLRIAWLDWSPAAALEPAGHAALARVRDRLAEQGASLVAEVPHQEVSALMHAHDIIMKYEFARNVGPVVAAGVSNPSQALRDNVAAGLCIPGAQYLASSAMRRERMMAWRAMAGQADLILTASTPGVAPAGLAYSGSPAFCKIWSVLGWPCVHVPVGLDDSGLPVGVQLVGPLYGDMELLEWARRIYSLIEEK